MPNCSCQQNYFAYYSLNIQSNIIFFKTLYVQDIESDKERRKDQAATGNKE